MPLNLPNDVWAMLLGAGALFLAPVLLIYIGYRVLRPRAGAKKPSGDE